MVVALATIGRMLMRLALHQRVPFAMLVLCVMPSGGSIVAPPACIAGGLMFAVLVWADNIARTVKTSPAVSAQPASRKPVQEVTV